MANNNAPFGLRPYKHLSGGVSGRTEEFSIASAYDTSIFTGDCVKSTGTGRNIAVSGEGDTILGVFQGCSYKNSAGERIYAKYWPADTVASEIVAFVCCDPNQTFLAMAEGSIVEADVNLLADLDTGTAGSTLTGVSGQKIGAHDGSEGTFKILRILETPVLKAGAGTYPNDGAPALSEEGNYALVEVAVAEHEYRGSMTEV